jgi:hypothetical protein
MRTHCAFLALVLLLSCNVTASASDVAAPGSGAETANTSSKPASDARHPGSYIGGGVGYAQGRAWIPEKKDEHGDLALGPVHTWQIHFRVGDALAEWFALGFQVSAANIVARRTEGVTAFNLFLDTSIYPIAGLGIRPSFGLGFSYARGKTDTEFGYGGPGSLSLAVLYEFRILRLLVVAPVVQAYWITSKTYDGLFLFFGLELLKWLDAETG